MTRRQMLGAGCGGVACLALHPMAGAASAAAAAPATRLDEAVSKHFPFGPVVPGRTLPALPLATSDGRKTDLSTLLRGKVTALQLMFTGCSATCPLQGALFMQTQKLLRSRNEDVQLVSITIDPTSDSPAELRNWLKKFDAAAGWIAATPRFEDLPRLTELLTAGGEHKTSDSDPHNGQVYLIDTREQLVYRTPAMPAADRLMSMIGLVSARG